jgi:RNA-directed DNA polymerase
VGLTPPEKVRELQRKLYLKSKAEKAYRFYSLYDKVCWLATLEEAWKQVRENKGGSGVDGKSIEEIEKDGVGNFIGRLREELVNKTYKAQPVKRVWIPKADGRKRPLGIPTVKDRVVQTAAKLIIEPIFEADFQDCSYGFRPGRSAHQVVKVIQKSLLWKPKKVIDADISDFFNNISHGKLLELIRGRIADRQVLKLIKQWLTCGVMEDGEVKRLITGTPQGGVISPLLANIYLNVLDKEWTERNRIGLKAQLIRYADDLLVIVDKNTAPSMRILERTLGQLGLQLNREKSRIIATEEAGFDFLGFNFRVFLNRKGTKKVPYVAPSSKAQKAVRAKIKEITRSRPAKVTEVIEQLNPVLRGWANYFRGVNSSIVFSKIRYYAEMKVRRFIRRQQLKSGYGFKVLTSEVLRENLGLYSDWKIVYDYF